METSTPRTSPTTSVRVTSPVINAKILHVPLDASAMTSQVATSNHRTSPGSRIPQPIGSNHLSNSSDFLANHHKSPTGRNMCSKPIPCDLVLLAPGSRLNHHHQKIGNGPIAMTSQPQQVYGNHANIIQPTMSRGDANLQTVVTVQGSIIQRE